MSVFQEAMSRIKRFEKFVPKPYLCSAGKWTIGYGRNIEDNGITEREGASLMVNDLYDSVRSVRSIFPNYATYPEKVRLVLLDMMFNMGKPTFLEFKKMIAAVKARDWKTAADEAEDSEWYQQVGHRGLENVRLLREVK